MTHQISTRCQKHNRSAKKRTRGGENGGQYTLWGKDLVNIWCISSFLIGFLMPLDYG